MTKSIKDLLSNFIPQEYTWKKTLLEHWEEIIGPLNKNVTLLKITYEKIYLGVSHPAWAQELHLLSPMLKKKINAYLKKDYIKEIRFSVVNGSSQKQTGKKQDNSLQNKATKKYTLTNKEKEMLKKFSDTDLQTLFGDYFVKCKQMKEGEKDEKPKKRGKPS